MEAVEDDMDVTHMINQVSHMLTNIGIPLNSITDADFGPPNRSNEVDKDEKGKTLQSINMNWTHYDWEGGGKDMHVCRCIV